jgi:hypothetical protein
MLPQPSAWRRSGNCHLCSLGKVGEESCKTPMSTTLLPKSWREWKSKDAGREDDLTHHLQAARRAAAAAETPLNELLRQIAGLNVELAATQSRIADAALDEMVRDSVGADMLALQRLVEAANSKISKLLWLRWFLSTTGQQAQARGDNETANQFFRTNEPLLALKTPVLSGNQLEINVAAEGWQARFRHLSEGE